MEVACIQYDPVIGQVTDNIKTVDDLISKFQTPLPNFIILPEMTFTGYVFESQEEIKPHLEPTPPLGRVDDLSKLGPSVAWAVLKTQSLNCWIVVGFPEAIEHENRIETEEKPIGFNSCAVINPFGEVIHVYQKHFLYEAEVGWAKPGQGFKHFDVPELGRLGVGICMDLNEDTARPESSSDCEFALYHFNNNTQLIMTVLNWLEYEELAPGAPSTCTILYWVSRLRPIIVNLTPGKRVFVVICNRIGTERGTTFAGTSCVFEISWEGMYATNNLSNSSTLKDLILTELDLVRVNMNYLYYLIDKTLDLLNRVHLVAVLPHDQQAILRCSLQLSELN